MHLQTEARISDQNVSRADRLDVAVLIPCYNEADTIRNTVRALPRVSAIGAHLCI